MSNFNPDTQPFELRLSTLPQFGCDAERAALVTVSDSIGFAKSILLQHKVKAFTGADVTAVAALILERLREERSHQQGGAA
jgi:hypothetical protein